MPGSIELVSSPSTSMEDPRIPVFSVSYCMFSDPEPHRPGIPALKISFLMSKDSHPLFFSLVVF